MKDIFMDTIVQDEEIITDRDRDVIHKLRKKIKAFGDRHKYEVTIIQAEEGCTYYEACLKLYNEK
jgi:hypothetical protein